MHPTFTFFFLKRKNSTSEGILFLQCLLLGKTGARTRVAPNLPVTLCSLYLQWPQLDKKNDFDYAYALGGSVALHSVDWLAKSMGKPYQDETVPSFRKVRLRLQSGNIRALNPSTTCHFLRLDYQFVKSLAWLWFRKKLPVWKLLGCWTILALKIWSKG